MKPTGNLLLNRMAGSIVGVMPTIPPDQKFNTYVRMLEDVSTKLRLDISSCGKKMFYMDFIQSSRQDSLLHDIRWSQCCWVLGLH